MTAAKDEAIVETPLAEIEAHDFSGPSLLELSILWLTAVVIFILVLMQFSPYLKTSEQFGDNLDYILAARSIQHWNLTAAAEAKQFWGVSYAMLPLLYLGLSPRLSLLAISLASSLASAWIARRLWGPWIAVYFALLNYTWLQMSFLGGSDSFCIVLLFSSFVLARKERWLAASALAAFATLVRPAIFFVLPAIGLALLFRKDYKRAVACTLIALAMAALYLLPFWIYFHDPLYQVHQYKQNDWQSGQAIGWPFQAIVFSLIHNREPWTNVIVTTAWVLFATAGFVLIARSAFRHEIKQPSNEWLFASLYIAFLLCYHSLHWARAEFPRFVIPAMPLLLFAFDRWLPKSRVAVYSLCILSPILAAFSTVGLQNVIATLHH